MIDEGNPAMRAFLADQLLQDIKAPLSKEEAKDIAKLTDGAVERISDEEKANIESMGYGSPATGPTEYLYMPPRLPAGPTLTTTLTPYTLSREQKQAEDAERLALSWKVRYRTIAWFFSQMSTL